METPAVAVYDTYPVNAKDERQRVRWTLVAESGDERHWRDHDGVIWRARSLFPRGMYRLASEHGPPRSFDHDFSCLVPLAVGKAQKSGTILHFPVDFGPRFERCTVEAREDITVPAGTFDTFRVACVEVGGLFSDQDKVVLHVAPEVPVFLRRRLPGGFFTRARVHNLVAWHGLTGKPYADTHSAPAHCSGADEAAPAGDRASMDRHGPIVRIFTIP